MKPLIDQPTSAPSRKLIVAMIVGAVMTAAQIAIAALIPEFDLFAVPGLESFLTGAVMSAFAYFTRNRAE